MKACALLFMLLLIGGCTPSLTSQTVLETPAPTKFTVPDEELPSQPEEKPMSCEEQLKEINDQKDEKEYDLLQVRGDQQKTAMELQYKKENSRYADETEQLLKDLKKFNDQTQTLKNDINSIKDAIRILEEKCPAS